MRAGQPSQTLLRSAVRRAQHQLMDAPLILHDPVAIDLVPEIFDPSVLPGFGDPDAELARVLRGLFAMRSRFAEDRLMEAAKRGARQYVMIGAGLDTFAWRQPGFASDMQLFAADHPDSLIWTQQRLRTRGLRKPANLTFVPVDLETQRLGEQLRACALDETQACFCSALGLFQYLSAEAIDATLRDVASLASGSEIVFSFVTVDDELDGIDREIAKRSVMTAGSAGEPWRSRFATRNLIERLVAAGFSDVFHLAPGAADSRYFSGRSDGLRAPRWEQMIAATV